MRSSNLNILSKFIVGTVSALTLTWLVYSWYSNQVVADARTQWVKHNAEMTELRHALYEVHYTLGYGDFTQKLKQNLLGNQPLNGNEFTKNIKPLTGVILSYRELPLSPQEEVVLSELELALSHYLDLFKWLQRDSAADALTHELDQEVEEVDAQLIEKILALDDIMDKRIKLADKTAMDSMEHSHEVSIWDWLWLPLLIALLMLLMVLIHQFKKVTEELQVSRKQVDDLLNAVPQATIVADERGGIVFANLEAQNLFGYGRAEFEEMNVDHLVPKRFRKGHLGLRNSYFSQPAPLHFGERGEVRALRKDGQEMLVDIGLSVMLKGEEHLIVASVQDISQRIKDERTLMAAKNKYRTFFEMAPEGILVIDPETALPIEFNHTAHHQLGYTAEEFARIPIFKHAAAESSEEARSHIQRIISSGRDDFETLHQRKDGELRNVLVSAKYMDEGDTPEFFIFFRDITDVRKLSERLELATKAGKVGVWDWNISTHKITWDDMMYSLYGVEKEENQNLLELWRDCLHPDDSLKILNQIQLMPEGNAEPNAEFRIVHPDGRVRYIQAATTVLRNTEDEPLRVLGVNWDITEVKEAESVLNEAKQSAESSSLAKSEFLANMSHEIRTPMNAIIGLTQLILGTKLSTVQKDYLTKIQGSSKSLLRILNDILDYSKIEAGRLELEHAQFSLDDILEQLSSLFSATLEAKGVELNFWVTPEVPRTLIGDALRVSQVLINLVSNAIKFTEYGEIQLHVRIEDQSEEEVDLRFTVVDSGTGISDEEMDRLFYAFSQADTSTTRRYGGTGLGLAISQNLVQMMGGTISVESNPGAGSSFSFNCKLGVATEEIKREFFDANALRVLVADGAESSRQSIGDMLDSWNIRVEDVENGSAALTSLKSASENNDVYDLLLLECCGNSSECLYNIELIRDAVDEGEITKMPIVILISGGHLGETFAQQYKEKFDALLYKPVIPSFLYDTLVGACEGAWGNKQSENVDLYTLAEPIHDARILLVEDNKINQQVASELLSKAGLDVYVANNGQEAVVAAENAQFDAILMDLQMPKMDGFRATSQIRVSNPHLPIIAMTAAAMVQDRERCLEAGMNDHIPKPIDPVDVVKSLLHWISFSGKAPGLSAISLGRAPGAETRKALPLDIEYGLGRAGGDEGIYARLLKQFCIQHKASGEELIELLAKGVSHDIRAWLHSMKGAAGTIGALQFFQLCMKYEKQLDDGKSISPEEGHGMLSALEDTLALIPEHIPKCVGKRISKTLSVAETLNRLEKIKELLTHSDLVEHEILDELGFLESHPKLGRMFNRLKASIDNFDYDDSLLALEKIIAVLKEGNE
ncbi:PAS domain S-box protein [Pseudomonadota bacterium]